jgi:hypothetical protein
VRWQVALAVFLFAWTLTTHGKYSVSGDEPHYLMMTHSLVVDGDLELENNYAGNDGRLFGHDGLAPGLHAIPARTGTRRSTHSVGLAMFLVPVYAVARQVARLPSEPLLTRFRMDRGLFTYSIVSLFLMALTAVGLMLLADGLAALAGPRAAALLAIGIGVSPPVVSHSFLVFPEVLALFCTAVVVWLTLKPETGTPRDRIELLAAALVLGVLPWAHHKYLLYTPGLLFLLLWTRWAGVRRLSGAERVAGVVAVAGPQLALHLWTWYEWGALGGPITVTTAGLPFSLDTFKAGIFGLWMDRQSGLLAYAPLYWVLPACMWVTRRTTWPYLVPAMLLVLPAASYTVAWWAGFSPAGRYVVPMIPLAAVVLAGALRHPGIRAATLALFVPQALIDGVVWQWPRSLWPASEGNAALQLLGPVGRAYETLLPDIQRGGIGPGVVWLSLALVCGSVAIVAGGQAYARRDAASTSSGVCS